MKEVALVAVVLALTSVLGLVWQRRNGRFRAVAPADATAGDAATRVVLTSDDVTAPLGARATFLQVSSEVCSACRSTHRVLSAVAAEQPGVVHVELDAVQHLDLVRRLDVLRTPTTFVLAHDGTVVGRMSGATDRPQALAALASCPDVAPAR
ncbi:thioredoxin family protein [Cellulomonas palmilytica]|uniref:thioredoxin family protein n=1 Tax=Cellulomonas palmilytica TaxID=2608402 RepID=UPI001F3D4BAF|nr:thioredoxin family protein [Cellulomonas palmilytica]UJP40175.1 thioredoxin family protein [Cellulomonas palmilytica]